MNVELGRAVHNWLLWSHINWLQHTTVWVTSEQKIKLLVWDPLDFSFALSSCVKVIQSCPTLRNTMDYTVHGILQARILEWVVFPFSRGSSQPRDQTQVSHIAGGFFTSWATREAQEYWRELPIPSPVDLPNPGIEPGSPALQADSLPTELSGKPFASSWYLSKFKTVVLRTLLKPSRTLWSFWVQKFFCALHISWLLEIGFS